MTAASGRRIFWPDTATLTRPGDAVTAAGQRPGRRPGLRSSLRRGMFAVIRCGGTVQVGFATCSGYMPQPAKDDYAVYYHASSDFRPPLNSECWGGRPDREGAARDAWELRLNAAGQLEFTDASGAWHAAKQRGRGAASMQDCDGRCCSDDCRKSGKGIGLGHRKRPASRSPRPQHFGRAKHSSPRR